MKSYCRQILQKKECDATCIHAHAQAVGTGWLVIIIIIIRLYKVKVKLTAKLASSARVLFVTVHRHTSLCNLATLLKSTNTS